MITDWRNRHAIVAIALATLTNVMLLLGISQFANPVGTIDHTAYYVVDGEVRVLEFHEGFGVTRVDILNREVPPKLDADDAPGWIRPTQPFAPPADPTAFRPIDRLLTLHARGWPLRAAWCEEVPSAADRRESGTIHGGVVLESVEVQLDGQIPAPNVLPMRPIWTGIAGNMAVHTFVWLFVVTLASRAGEVIRIHHRDRPATASTMFEPVTRAVLRRRTVRTLLLAVIAGVAGNYGSSLLIAYDADLSDLTNSTGYIPMLFPTPGDPPELHEPMFGTMVYTQSINEHGPHARTHMRMTVRNPRGNRAPVIPAMGVAPRGHHDFPGWQPFDPPTFADMIDEQIRTDLILTTGWPVKGVWCHYRTTSGMQMPTGDEALTVRGGIVVSDEDWPGGAFRSPKVLPLYPRFPGLVINAAFYGLAALVLLAPFHLYHVVRWSRRVRAGRCLGCGYDLGGAETCSECGRARWAEAADA